MMLAVAYQHALTDDEKRELLRIARATLREHCHSGRIPPGKPHRESLVAPAAVFVTLHSGKAVRGYAGAPLPTTPLYRAIQETAVAAAAARDPQSPAVDEDELDRLVIEIAVLGPRLPVRLPRDIEIGSHGLAIELGGTQSVLLPQAAVDAGWDAETFLAQLCSKAKLAPEAWKDPSAHLEVFTVQVFDEKSYPPRPRI